MTVTLHKGIDGIGLTSEDTEHLFEIWDQLAAIKLGYAWRV